MVDGDEVVRRLEAWAVDRRDAFMGAGDQPELWRARLAGRLDAARDAVMLASSIVSHIAGRTPPPPARTYEEGWREACSAVRSVVEEVMLKDRATMTAKLERWESLQPMGSEAQNELRLIIDQHRRIGTLLDAQTCDVPCPGPATTGGRDGGV